MDINLIVGLVAFGFFTYFNVQVRRNLKPGFQKTFGVQTLAFLSPKKYLTDEGKAYRNWALITVLIAMVLSEIFYQLR
jgi:hypothetical protein